MDLLGSILGGMDALPKKHVDEDTKRKAKEAKEKAEKFKEKERQRKAEFRIKIESRLNNFLQGPSEERKLTFDPMNQVERGIVHDVAETAGLSAYSFGEEDVDRYTIVWKKEHAPSEAELEALHNGEEYDPTSVNEPEEETNVGTPCRFFKRFDNDPIPTMEKKFIAFCKSFPQSWVKRKKNLRSPYDRTQVGHHLDSYYLEQSRENLEKLAPTRKRRSKNTTSEPEKYFEKYAKIVGKNSGLEAAKITQSNQSYGMVPSKNKQDKRSIEETMKELSDKRKEKKLNSGNVS